jgi:hypothetical protein
MSGGASTSNIFNVAKSTFEKKMRGTTSGDYLKNKKSKLTYCNGQSCGNPLRVSSYDQKFLYQNGKYLNEIMQNGFVDPNHKFDMINNLYSELDLSGAFVVTDISDNNLTNIDISLIPFYENYMVDPDSSLFNNSMCNTNKYVNYMTSNLNYVPPTTVFFN